MSKLPAVRSLLSIGIVAGISAGGEGAFVTDPVGALKVAIQGSGATTLISAGGFTQPVAYSGQGRVTTGNTLEDPFANWPAEAFDASYYVLLESGDWAAISTNTETLLTLESVLPAGPDVRYRILPLQTLNSLFGPANRAGFTGGPQIAAADILIFWDNPGQAIAGYYYFNTRDNCWKDAFDDEAGDVILYPDESVIVFSSGLMDKSILLTGTVQQGSTSGTIAGNGGTTLLPNPYPMDLRISDCGLEDVLTGGSTVGNSDLIGVFDPETQAVSKVFYFDLEDGLWKDAFAAPVTGEDVLPAGCALIVIKHGQENATWYLDPPFPF